MNEKIIVILLIIVLVFIIYNLIYLKIDISGYVDYYNTINFELANKNTSNLINANTLSNLPDINITTTNEDINIIRSCLTDPVQLAPYDEYVDLNVYRTLCFSTCGNNAEVVLISDDEEYYVNSSKLNSGVWCMINPPACNTKTAMIIATVAGTACKSKYPRLFDNSGYSIVACNNNDIYNTKNVLWDNLNNVKVDPLTISITDEDEKLPSGGYRFICKYNDDEDLNRLIENPIDRLQPIKDRCLIGNYAASYDAHTTFKGDSYICDCGNYNDTRLKNRNGDEKQPCTSCIHSEVKDGYTDIVSVPYNCTILNTEYSTVSFKPACGPSKFTRLGNDCDVRQIRVYRTDDFKSVGNSYIHDLRVMPLAKDFVSTFNSYTTMLDNDIIFL